MFRGSHTFTPALPTPLAVFSCLSFSLLSTLPGHSIFMFGLARQPDSLTPCCTLQLLPPPSLPSLPTQYNDGFKQIKFDLTQLFINQTYSETLIEYYIIYRETKLQDDLRHPTGHVQQHCWHHSLPAGGSLPFYTSQLLARALVLTRTEEYYCDGRFSYRVSVFDVE